MRGAPAYHAAGGPECSSVKQVSGEFSAAAANAFDLEAQEPASRQRLRPICQPRCTPKRLSSSRSRGQASTSAPMAVVRGTKLVSTLPSLTLTPVLAPFSLSTPSGREAALEACKLATHISSRLTG